MENGECINSCSILEMMIALARRCEKEIMNNSDEENNAYIWITIMLRSLGLYDQTNNNYYPSYVDHVIDIFLSRRYSRTGRGGLFRVDSTSKDMRHLEIWYQMQEYIIKQYVEEYA